MWQLHLSIFMISFLLKTAFASLGVHYRLTKTSLSYGSERLIIMSTMVELIRQARNSQLKWIWVRLKPFTATQTHARPPSIVWFIHYSAHKLRFFFQKTLKMYAEYSYLLAIAYVLKACTFLRFANVLNECKKVDKYPNIQREEENWKKSIKNKEK